MNPLEYSIDGPPPGFGVWKSGVVWVSGWAFDAQSGNVPTDVSLWVDGVRRGRANIAIVRADVAAHFNRPEVSVSGFTCMLPTTNLSVGQHVLRLAFTFGNNGQTAYSADHPFFVRSPFAYAWSGVRRIVLVGAPKTGGTYQESVLCKYFGIDNPPYNGEWRWEPLLGDGRIPDVPADRPFITGGHLMPREPTLGLMRQYGLAPGAGWRNIADALVSLDDHFHNETHVWPWTYIGDRERYVSMPAQERYRYLIWHAAPWYIDYYFAWRDVEIPIFACYEWMATEPMQFFEHVIRCLSGSVDKERLLQVIGEPISGTRFNKGVNGRAAALFDDRTKTLLEDLLREHYADTSGLIEELPWRGGAQAAVAAALAAKDREENACAQLRSLVFAG